MGLSAYLFNLHYAHSIISIIAYPLCGRSYDWCYFYYCFPVERSLIGKYSSNSTPLFHNDKKIYAKWKKIQYCIFVHRISVFTRHVIHCYNILTVFIHFNLVLIYHAYELFLPSHRLRSPYTVPLDEKVHLIWGKRRWGGCWDYCVFGPILFSVGSMAVRIRSWRLTSTWRGTKCCRWGSNGTCRRVVLTLWTFTTSRLSKRRPVGAFPTPGNN